MNAERARLFVALELPGEVRDALGRWTLAVMGAVQGMRPTPPGHLHVTLCFLGWRSVEDIEPVAEACGGIRACGPLSLAIAEAVWLPPRRPRVLGVRLADQADRLARLQSRLSDLLEAGGWYVPEHRRYLPHVTVARAAGPANPSSAPLLAPPSLTFIGTRVTLFRSRLARGGARYEALSSVELA